MLDRRELILAQLMVLLTGIKTANPDLVKNVVRNRGLMKNEARPAIVLLDGDEASRLNRDRKNGRAVGLGPTIMQMRPQIFILAEEQRPTNSELGPDLNGLRIKIIDALEQDTVLPTLFTANGSINYLNTVTDMKSGGAVTGLMYLDFAITYPLG